MPVTVDSALGQVHDAARAAGARQVTTWAQGENARVTVHRPIDYRDEGDAIRIAVDAGADPDRLSVERDIVRGWVVITDDTKRVVVQVHVLYGSALDHYEAVAAAPVAAIPLPRDGDVEVIDRDDLAHDRDDAIRDETFDMLISGEGQ